MAVNLQNPPNPSACSCCSSSSTNSMLQESIKLFLSQIESGNSEFSHFNLMFSRIVHTMPSPPIEVIWFYSAVNFHSHTLKGEDELGRVLALKDLFHLLVSCSGSGPCSSTLKKVAVLAPLIYELYNLICDLKTHKKVTGVAVTVAVEIGCLVERVVSFISLCCCEPVTVDHHDHTLAFSPCFLGLINVWTARKRHSGFSSQSLDLFFPIVSHEVRNGLWVGGRATASTATVGVLAGIVMCQAFLLYLCFKCGSDLSSQLQDVTNLSVHTISAFRSCYFFDTLLKMLLESSLPVTSLLNVADEAQLREAMFDAIVLVDYPFFNPAYGICLCSHHLNRLATTWLSVADKAIQFVRHNGDKTKQNSYFKAFSNSPILSQLLKWLSTQIVMVETNKPKLTTSAAFRHWIVQLSSQASSGFDDELPVLCEKAVNYLSEMKSTLLYLDELDNNFNNDQPAGDDDRVDEDFEMIDSTDNTKIGCNFKITAIDADACRKRKEEQDEGGLRVKLLKYQISGSPIRIISPF